MTQHLDQADLLEILYLDELTDQRSDHLGSCIRCHDRFTALRDELDQDRGGLAGRVDSKPDAFWARQREQIVADATSRARGSFAFLRFRPAFSILMAVLLVTIGIVMIRTAEENRIAPTPIDVAVAPETSEELFGSDDLRAIDPWETDELESFHQIVEWEEWLDDDLSSNGATEEES